MVKFNGNYKEYELGNGLVVALKKEPTQTVMGKLRVNFGPVHEREDERGLAHFLEHFILSAGSERYSLKEFEEIRNGFGRIVENTTIGRTNYGFCILKEDIKKLLEFISSSVFNPAFNEEIIEGERRRILDEIARKKSRPSFLYDLQLNNEIYRGHPKGIIPIGYEDVVVNTSVDKLRQFHKRGYHPNNMDLILVGNLPDNINGLIEKNFGNQKSGENTRIKFPPLNNLEKKVVLHNPSPERENREDKNQSIAHITLAYVVAPATHPEMFALNIMRYILGGDENSRLYKRLGLGEGLYSVSATYNGEYNAGEFFISADIPALRIDRMIDIIFEEINGFKTKKISNKEVERAKKRMRYALAINSDSA